MSNNNTSAGVALQKYIRYQSNIQLYININKPTEEELVKLEQMANDYTEVIEDLERIVAESPSLHTEDRTILEKVRSINADSPYEREAEIIEIVGKALDESPSREPGEDFSDMYELLDQINSALESSPSPLYPHSELHYRIKKVLLKHDTVFTAPEKAPALREEGEEDCYKALKEILDICGTVNFSSHNQMRQAIESAVDIADVALAASPAPSVAGSVEERAKEGNPVAEMLLREMIFQRNVQCPYPSESQSEAAYYKGFEECWATFYKHLAGAAESEGRFAEWVSEKKWQWSPENKQWLKVYGEIEMTFVFHTTSELYNGPYQEYLKQLNK